MKKNRQYTPASYTDPFDPYAQTNQDPFTGTPTAYSDAQQALSSQPQQASTTIVQSHVKSFPDHLYVPKGSQSLDIRRLVSMAAFSVDEEVFRFQAPRGQRVWFLGYSIFSDGELASTQEFIPRVNGNRVFPYHGDPNDNFRINLGLGPDMSNQNVIHCQLPLEPTQVLTWSFTNSNAVPIAMGVRMIGYLDSANNQDSTRVGG